MGKKLKPGKAPTRLAITRCKTCKQEVRMFTGAWLRHLRLKAGKTLADIGIAAGVSRQYIWHLEHLDVVSHHIPALDLYLELEKDLTHRGDLSETKGVVGYA